MSNEQLDQFLGLLLVLFGCSFAYKFFLACVLGKSSYWSGFLPITVISPFFTHLPRTSKRSLIHDAQGLWVHFLLSPLFLICSTLCFTAGAEFLGMPGVSVLNKILSGGKEGAATAVLFDRHRGFRFPFLQRSTDTLARRISNFKFDVSSDKEMVHDSQLQDMKEVVHGNH